MVKQRSLYDVYAEKSDVELIGAVTIDHEDYTDEAYSVMRRILRSRGFDLTVLDQQRREIDLYRKAADWRELSTFRVYGCGTELRKWERCDAGYEVEEWLTVFWVPVKCSRRLIIHDILEEDHYYGTLKCRYTEVVPKDQFALKATSHAIALTILMLVAVVIGVVLTLNTR